MAFSPDQLSACSAMKLSRHESLVDHRFAERWDKLTTVPTPASFAACAKFTIAWISPGCTGQTK
jgi:hypothetical protein